MNAKIYDYLAFIYGDDMATALQPQLTALLDAYKERMPPATQQHYFDEGMRFNHLWGYGTGGGPTAVVNPLPFLKEQVGGLIRGVHLLPFIPIRQMTGFRSLTTTRSIRRWEIGKM